MTRPYVPPTTVVRVNGVVQRHADVIVHGRIAAELDNPHTGTHGIITTTADVTWLPTSSRPDHPWLPDLPVEDGDEITIDLVWAAKTSRRFTGTVLTTRFDLDTGTVVSRCRGREDWMAVQGELPPVAYTMPPYVYEGNYRRPGMGSPWVTGHLLRQAGFSAVAPQHPTAMVFASMEGSLWATKGKLTEGWSNTRGEDLAPYYRQTAWGGVAMVDPYAVWVGNHTGSASDPWSLVVDLGDPRTGYEIVLTGLFGQSGTGFELEWTDTGIACRAIHPGGPTGLFSGDVDGSATTRLQLIVTPNGSNTTWQFRRDDDDYLTTVNTSLVTAADLQELTTTVSVDADLGDVSGVQVFRAAEWLVDEPRTVRFRRDAYDMATNGGIGVVPYTRDKEVLDLVADQAEKEWIDFWVDETGVAQVCDRDVLETQDVTKVITDARVDGLLDLPQNGFRSLPDGTPTPGRPYPVDDTGITLVTNTAAAYTTDGTGPHVRLVNIGSTAAPGQRGMIMLVPIREGEHNTLYAETRTTTDVKGMLRARYYTASHSPLLSAAVTGEPAGGTMDWATVQVKLPKAPPGAAYARVEAVNGSSLGTGIPVPELHFRNFTTYGPAVALLKFAARTPGLGSFGGVAVNRRVLAGNLQVRPVPTLLYWDAGKENLNPGEEYERVATPQSRGDMTVHWLEDSIDLDWFYAGSPGAPALNKRYGTVVGGQIIDDDNDAKQWVVEEDWPFEVEQITHEAVVFRGTVAATLPNSGTQVETVPYQDSPSVGNVRKQESTVQLRGTGWFALRTGDPVTRDLGKPGPDYIHDGGWYLQSDYQAGQVADKLRDWIENPRAVIERLEVPLVDVNRGDRVLVRLSNIAGVTLDVKVIGIDEAHAAGVMTLTAQVLDADVTSLTLPQIPDIDEFLSA